MKEIKNLLVNGCSFSRGPGSWPYYLKYQNIVNLAQAGAGNTYIHETTVSELSQRSYDFVVVMWTGIHRVDLKVANIQDFAESKYTSQYQHQQNDWPEKQVVPIDDQNYVEKNWVFGCGHVNNESAIKRSKIFDGIYKYVAQAEFTHGLLIKMISLQNILKQIHVPYLFTFYEDYDAKLKTVPHLYNMLDQDHIYNEQNIYTITKANKWFDQDGSHPSVTAHQTWAQQVQKKIEEIYETN